MGVINSNAFVSFDAIIADQSAQIEFLKADSTIEDFLHVYLEADRTSFRAEEELIEFEAPGNAGTDNLLIYSSSEGGKILQNSTIITTDNIFEIDHNGAIDSSLGAITINEHVIDLAGITIDDGGAAATVLRGYLFEGSSIAPAGVGVGLSTLVGMELQMPAINGVYNDGAGLIVSENTNDCIVELANTDGNAILVRGGTINDGRNWNMTYPNTAIVTADVVNRMYYTTLEDITIDDIAPVTPEFYGHHMIMRPSAETNVGNTVMYGHYIQMPDLMASYATGAGLTIIEGSGYVVEMVNIAENALLIRGDSIRTRDWIHIIPDPQTINAANTIKYFHLDTDNLTITDGATAPNIYGIHLEMNNITETDVNLTDLWGIYVDISPTLVNYADGAAAYFTDATQSVKILDGTTALTVVGGLALDTLDLTPTTNVDALDINLENDAWTSASAIDIDIGDWIGGSNIIEVAATQVGTIATHASMIKLDGGTNITFSDAGAGTQLYSGLNVDMSAITAAHANFLGLAGIAITMPAAAHASWGGNKTSAIHATGNGNIFDALLGDGIRLTMAEAGSIAINLISDTEDLSNAMLPIYASKDMNVTVAAAGGATLTNSGNTAEINIDTYSLDTTPAVNPHNTSAVGLRVYQRHRQGAASDVGNIDEVFSGTTLDLDQVLTINNTNAGTPTIATTAPFIEMDLTVTETAGAITIGAVDWVSLGVSGGSVVSAAAARGFVFNSSLTLNHANAEFYGFSLNTTGMTNTVSQADSVGGFYINDDGILDYGIKATNATDILKFMDTENTRGIYLDMATAASLGLVIESDTIGTVANAMQTLNTSRDFAGVTTADIAMTNYSVTHGVVNVNTPTTDFDFDFESGVVNLIMQQTNASTFDKTNPDKFNATTLKIEVDAITSSAAAELDAAPRAIDIDFAVTETLGTLQLGTTDVMRVNFSDLIFSTAGAMNLHGINAIVSNAETFNDGNITFKLINVDASNITNTASALLVGHDITMGASADAGLRVTMGATPAIGGIEVVCNAATDIGFTTNGEIIGGEIIGGNYPATNDMAFECMTPDSLSNASISLDYEATVGGDANRKGNVYKILATAATATGSLYFQYKVPSDYKGMVGTADIAAEIAAYDAVGGPGVIGTLAFSVFEETNGAAINTTTAAQNITGGAAADTWTDIASLAAGVDDIADGSGVGAGEKLIIKVDFSIPVIADYIKISLPDFLYGRTS